MEDGVPSCRLRLVNFQLKRSNVQTSNPLTNLKPDSPQEGKYVFYLQEIKNLKERKLKLMGEIKKLGVVFEKLNISKEKVEKGVGEFAMGRFKELEGIGSDVMASLQLQKNLLSKESAQHTVHDVLLGEISDYLTELAVILEAESDSNASKRASETERASTLAKERENLNKLSKEVVELHTKATSDAEKVDRKLKEVEKMRTILDDEIVTERRRLEKRSMDLVNKEIELESREKTIITDRERLKALDTRLKDKEEALERAKHRLEMI